MPFCTNCGAEIPRADASHCTSCGAEIPAEKVTESDSESQQGASSQPREQQTTPSQQPSKGAQQPNTPQGQAAPNQGKPSHRHGQSQNSQQQGIRSGHAQRTPDPSGRGSRDSQQPGAAPHADQQSHDAGGRTASVDGSAGGPSTTWRNVALGLSAIATLSILAFFALAVTMSSPGPGTSTTVAEAMIYLLWAYPLLSLLAGVAIVADWWALKQANVSWLPAFGYAIGIGIFALTPIAAPIYYFHRP